VLNRVFLFNNSLTVFFIRPRVTTHAFTQPESHTVSLDVGQRARNSPPLASHRSWPPRQAAFCSLCTCCDCVGSHFRTPLLSPHL